MLASGLMEEARVLPMDEAMNGVDADARTILLDVIRREPGRRLFPFSTHDAALVAASGARVLDLSAPAAHRAPAPLAV
ncbi:ATP-binding cassette domain-containing protein [Massilia niastensis]|uniref:ATP-binding cassette domain-containing protein n=1 Tax=Massilia niastensis TaxID=544911 RepID=UPI00035FB138|nr:ABC transporter ATP-binding protein [Massilia niastensis]